VLKEQKMRRFAFFAFVLAVLIAAAASAVSGGLNSELEVHLSGKKEKNCGCALLSFSISAY
jgi:hypothetical protein